MRFPIAPMPEPDSPQMFPSRTTPTRSRGGPGGDRDVRLPGGGEPAGDRAGAAAGGGTSTSDPQGLFTQNCGAATRSAPRGRRGRLGPDLDQISPPLARIVEQIHKGGGGMPAFAGT